MRQQAGPTISQAGRSARSSASLSDPDAHLDVAAPYRVERVRPIDSEDERKLSADASAQCAPTAIARKRAGGFSMSTTADMVETLSEMVAATHWNMYDHDSLDRLLRPAPLARNANWYWSVFGVWAFGVGIQIAKRQWPAERDAILMAFRDRVHEGLRKRGAPRDMVEAFATTVQRDLPEYDAALKDTSGRGGLWHVSRVVLRKVLASGPAWEDETLIAGVVSYLQTTVDAADRMCGVPWPSDVEEGDIASPRARAHEAAMEQFGKGFTFWVLLAAAVGIASLAWRPISVGLYFFYVAVMCFQCLVDLLKMPALLRGLRLEGVDTPVLIAIATMYGKDVFAALCGYGLYRLLW